MEERFIYLVKRRLTNTATLQEEEELSRLVEQDEELKQLYNTLFLHQPVNNEQDLLETEQAYASHSVKMQLNNLSEESDTVQARMPVAEFRTKWYAYAAMIIGGLFIGFLVYLTTNKNDHQLFAQKNEVATRKGSKSKIILPDSTVVWLNADSRISYPDNFRGEKREVQLTGEAFFEVTKDANRPFIIHTNTIDIKVIGTVFNVRSYPEEATTETSLLTGEVEVTVLNQDKKVILKPNEKLIVPNEIAGVIKDSVQFKRRPSRKLEQSLLTVDKIHFNEEDSIYSETCWIDNKLRFDGEQLDRLTSKIERWYNVEVIINNEKLKATRFTATFENESLNEVMEALSYSYSFKYKMENGKVIIY